MALPTAETNAAAFKRILIVDDDANMLDLLRHLLCDYQDVQVAASGPVALRLARAQRPDLILLDVQMPGLDGMATCQLMRAEPSLADIPILFLTARQDSRTIVEAFKAGGTDFITKPVREQALLRRVEAQLAT